MQPPLLLGIEKSDQKSDNLVGFNDPTPHAAMESEIDQPALDPMAGAEAASGAPAPKGEPDRPPAEETFENMNPLAEFGPPRPPEIEMEPRPRGDAPADALPRPEQLRGDPAAPVAPGEGPAAGPEIAQPMATAKTRGGEVAEPATGHDERTTKEQHASQPQALPLIPGGIPESSAKPSKATPGEASEAPVARGNAPGDRSEKESDAASKTKPVEVILGRPAAGEGLEIITKRPKRNPFSLLTRVTALPTNPVVEVKFSRDGSVAHARVVRSSGVVDVDDPVLAAVYGWTAKGSRLSDLDERDPDATYKIRVTILLR